MEVAVERTKHPKPRPDESTYGFGRYFSDHMFTVECSEKTGWTGAKIIPYGPIALDPGATVLQYGQALFEGMKAFRGADGKVRLFRPEMNHKRLVSGAERLCMKAPNYQLFLEALHSLVRVDLDWVPSSPNTSLYLRPSLIGTEAFLGVRPSDNYLFYVIASPVGAYYGEGNETVKIWIEEKYSRCAPGGIGAVKAGGNYASSLRAASEAKIRGFAQVLWLDSSEKKYIEEVGTMNVFFKIGDRLVTPPLSGTVLPGVMRDSVIEMMQKRGTPVDVRPIEINEVVQAHKSGKLLEAFGTGTAASVSPIGALGIGKEMLTINGERKGPLAADLYKSITDIQYGKAPDTMGWTSEVQLL